VKVELHSERRSGRLVRNDRNWITAFGGVDRDSSYRSSNRCLVKTFLIQEENFSLGVRGEGYVRVEVEFHYNCIRTY
jgi:hypothetical protein